jgi:dipeptidyl aminopeptidase/acylaminoacyl peptidase
VLKCGFFRFALLVMFTMGWVVPTSGAAQLNERRRVTVADTIRMTTVPEVQYAAADGSSSRIALFSPDGKELLIVTERGIVETNEREFSLLRFETSELFRSPKPEVLLSMRSRSNRDAIRNVKWLDDETLIFLGESHDSSQVYLLHLRTREIEQLTEHPSPIVDFDFNPVIPELVYIAEPGRLSPEAAYARCARGYAITNEALDDVPRSLEDCKQPALLEGLQAYVKKPGALAVQIPFGDYYDSLKPISLSPGGKFAIFNVLIRAVPTKWREYEDPFIRAEALASRNRGPFSWLSQYMIVNTATGQVRPIVDGPVDLTLGASVWSPDGDSVVVSGAFLPLDAADPKKLSVRRTQPFVVEIELASGNFVEVSDKQLIADRWSAETNELFLRAPNRHRERGNAVFRKVGTTWTEEASLHSGPSSPERPKVTLEQDINTPPKIYACDAEHPQKRLVLDLNPELEHIELGKVERVSWKAKDGHEVEGGLYYPPDFRPGTRYPLVIQTHGFSQEEFWINGPWNSAFAAQPLAARDIVVLQTGSSTEKGADGKAQGTPEEAPRQMSGYEGAIDYLDALGLIDRDKVGIIGFSRTVYSVEYTLTHSSYHFAAATAADGFDGGYMQYLVNPYTKRDYNTVNGGDPFGTVFELWRERSPSFTVEHLHSPVRLEGYGDISSVLGNWEWYAKLILLDRPVDMIYIPDGEHLLVKPWERLTSQQGSVDWFCFWLKSEVDSDPQKREQYKRWEEMRLQQVQSNQSRLLLGAQPALKTNGRDMRNP